MYRDLTRGSIVRPLLLFALPMLAGDLLQQLYNIADTLIVSRVIGRDALAAVGSAYTLMIFITSILLGLSMGAGALFSIFRGRGDDSSLRRSIVHAFGLIGACALLLTALAYALLPQILTFLQVPEDVSPLMRAYLLAIFAGIPATFLYNFFACLLRAVGNSATPLLFSGISAVLNVGLDLLFVLVIPWGVSGAAWATVISQYVAGLGLMIFTLLRCPSLRPKRGEVHFDGALLREIFSLSSLTCVQQSVMNFGILMIQGLVNSFGEIVMAAFAAAVKIESFAYMPAQDFGNAFSTFVAQNYGAGQSERIRKGTRCSFALVLGFCAVISALVFVFAEPLMRLFISAGETEVIAQGVHYLRCVAPFYFGIGFLFLFYALYRAVKRPAMSVVLTVISLGTRVALAYLTAGRFGVTGIWAAIPIGWILADTTGAAVWLRTRSSIEKAIAVETKPNSTEKLFETSSARKCEN